MALSNRKRKQLRNLAGRRPVAELAAALGVTEAEVTAELASWRAAGMPEAVPAMPGLVWLLLGLVVIGPLIWWNGLYDFADGPKALLIQSGALWLLLLWLGQGLWRGRIWLRGSPLLLPLVACTVWALVALAYGHNRYEGVWYLLRWLPVLPVLVVGAALLRDAAWRRWLLLAVGLTGVFTALLGVVQALTGWSPVEQAQPPAASFANRNMAVDYLVLALPVLVAWALDSPSRRQRLAAAASVGLMLFFIAATACRAGWLAATVQGCCWLALILWRWRRGGDREMLLRARVVAVAVALALVAALLLPVSRQAIQRRARIPVGEVYEQVRQPVPGEERESSIVWRVRTWINTIGMIKDHWLLGVGLGNHKVVYPLYHRWGVVVKQFDEKRQLAHVHNDFLQLWAEAGLIGLLLLLWLGAVAVREYLAHHERIVPGWPALSWSLGIAALGGLGVTAFFSFPLYRAGPPLVVGVWLAVIAAAAPEPAGGMERRVGRGWVAAAAGLLALIAVHLFWSWHFLVADRLHRLAISADEARMWDRVVDYGRAALHHDPWRMKTQFYVGRALAELKRSKEAIAALEEVVAAYPHYLNAWYNLGLAYADAKDDANAIRAYREAVGIKPDFALGQNNLGCLYLRKNQVAEAETCFRAAIEADPNNALAWNNLGLVALRHQDYQGAAANFAKSLELDPNALLANKHLGILYYQYLDRRQEALPYLRRALELDPKQAEADVIRQILAAEEAGKKAPPSPRPSVPRAERPPGSPSAGKVPVAVDVNSH